jgi:hypothetical protein
MPKPTGDLRTALSWCYVARRQIERVRASFTELEASAFPADDPAVRESVRARSLQWGDAQFLIIATYHMIQALQGMPKRPKLPKRLRKQLVEFRHLIDHWWEAQVAGQAWSGFMKKDAEFAAKKDYAPAAVKKQHATAASPWSVTSEGTDLKIGADNISVNELEQVLDRLLEELLQFDTGEPQHVSSQSASGTEEAQAAAKIA